MKEWKVGFAGTGVSTPLVYVRHFVSVIVREYRCMDSIVVSSLKKKLSERSESTIEWQ